MVGNWRDGKAWSKGPGQPDLLSAGFSCSGPQSNQRDTTIQGPHSPALALQHRDLCCGSPHSPEVIALLEGGRRRQSQNLAQTPA